MSYVNVAPGMVAATAEGVSSIGTTLSEVNGAAAVSTTNVLAAGADEVSVAITSLFNGHAQLYQELAARAAAFHQQFTRALAAAGNLYREAEQANNMALVTRIENATGITSLFEAVFGNGGTPIPPLPTPPGSTVALIVGATEIPNPSAIYLADVQNLFIQPRWPGAIGNAVFTPEQFWPVSPQLGGNLTLGQSISHGVTLLNNAIHTQLAAGNNTIVFGASQSSTIVTDEIRALMAAGSPATDKLSFVLTGDPNNPVGGVFERFTGLYIPGLDVLFNGATPPNSPYPTFIYTNEYDGVANFPQYPLNVLADVNAVMGVFLGAHDYADILPSQVANAIQLPTSPGYTGVTQYYWMPTQNLPLLDPLRYIPHVGNAVADLLQPDMRVLVDIGYGSGNYANIPTPPSLLQIPNPFTIIPDLAVGAIQGPQSALVDLGLLPQSMLPNAYPYLPALNPDLNFNLGQSSVTGLSVLTGAEGALAGDLGLIPPWDLG
jgi:hypothetical protein